MSEPDFGVMALVLSASCLLAGAFVRRGSRRRGRRWMLGIGAALGGVALLLLAATGS